MGTLSRYLEQRSKRQIACFAVFLTLALGVVDAKIGSGIHFLLLYLAPIFIAAWFVSLKTGLCIAVFASLVWLVANALAGHSYASPWTAYWNFFMRTGAFIVFALTQAQLRAKLDELSQLAARDFLTGLPNGRAFYQLTAKEIERAFGLEPLTFAYIDVTGMQWVNDRFGYPAGDQMLCTIAHTIRKHVPRPDLVGRLAGTSFAVLLPNTTSDAARLILERVKESLHEERRRHAHPLTYYISAVACTKAPRTLAELMHQAEIRMTRMKSNKRDTVQIARVDELPVLN